MTRALSVFLLLGLLQTHLAEAANEAQAEAEISYLLNAVSQSGCTFIRNSEQYTAPDAADHLRLKYSRGKRYATSAEQFIDRLATESSWTGTAYEVICAGTTEPSAQWLYRALLEHRNVNN